MMVPKDSRVTPPGLWRYVHPTTGVKFSGHFSISSLVDAVKKYNKANNLDEIVGLPDLIVAYICQEVPTYCESTEPPTWAEKAMNFASAARDWVSSGFRHVTHEQYEIRKEICLKCPYWAGSMAMGYGGCSKCGCSGLKLFLPSQRCPDGRWSAIND